jgi:hypothetical protein
MNTVLKVKQKLLYNNNNENYLLYKNNEKLNELISNELFELKLPNWVHSIEKHQIELKLKQWVREVIFSGINFNEELIDLYMKNDSKPFECIWLSKKNLLYNNNNHKNNSYYNEEIEIDSNLKLIFDQCFNNNNNSFIPIILISASDSRLEPKSFGWNYIQGAGDDHGMYTFYSSY